MRLTVLGGSAAWPNSGQGCSSYLVTSGRTTIVVDCGPDTLHELRRQVDFRDVDAVVISHMHADHILDLVPFRYGLLYGPRPVDRAITVWLPPGGRRVLARLALALSGGGEPARTYWDKAFELREYDPADVVHVGDVKVTFAPTQHYVPCWAFRIKDGQERTLFYSADTGVYEPLVGHAHGCDVALVEATLERQPDGPSSIRGHLTPEEAGALATAANARMLVATHYWTERPDDDVAHALSTTYDGPILLAKPGMSIDV